MSGPEVIAGLYAATLTALAALGAHRLFVTLLATRARHDRPAPPAAPLEAPPTLLIQLPLYNEAAVVERLLRAVAELRYPRSRLRVQVLDDSSDETTEIAAAVIAELESAGLAIEHIRRPDREGYKAGALAYGLARSDAELVAIFDADFVPEPSFLERLVPLFEDPELGLAQARWRHLNARQSLLTRLQALLLDAHFRVEQQARSTTGRFFNFNGTAGIWRRRAIDDAGGWEGDTLTEDLDLSLRAQLVGWRFRYVDEVAAPAELPSSLSAFRTQQHRWVKGSGENLRKLLGALWRSPAVPLRARIEASCQLLLNLGYPLVLLLALLSVPLVSLGLPLARAEVVLDLAHLALMLVAAGSVGVFVAASQRAEGPGAMLGALALLPAIVALGFGLAFANSLAYLSGLLGRRSAFVRTPKRGAGSERYRPRRELWMPAVELALGLYVSCGIGAAIVSDRWLALPFLALEAIGFLAVGGRTWLEAARASRRAERRPARTALSATSA